MTAGSDRSWAERFDAFAATRTRAALDAELAPWITDVDRASTFRTPPFDAISSRWVNERFDGPFYVSPAGETLPSTSLVFVQSSDGNTVADDPGALGGGETDKHVVYEGLSRVAADAVLAGAETIRGGDIVFSVWHPEMVALRRELGLPRHPIQIVATLRGLEFAHALLFNVPDLPVVVLTVARVAKQSEAAVVERPWIRVVTLDDPANPRSALAALRASGIGRISVVGGRTVAAAFIDAGLVGDLYLTTSARAGGQPNTPLYPHPIRRELVVRKRGTGPDEGVRFEHFRLST